MVAGCRSVGFTRNKVISVQVINFDPECNIPSGFENLIVVVEQSRFAFIVLELRSVFLSIVCGRGISLE